MHIAVIGDLHFGLKEGYPDFINYQIETYKDTIKEIKERGIREVIIVGDIVDNRKSISYPTLKLIWDNLIDPDLNYTIIAGNHDVYYKNTNKLNSIRALFGNLSNVTIIDEKPEEITIDGTLCLFIPWITEDNHDVCIKTIKNSTAKYSFAHFDIDGALMTKGITCKSKLKPKMFNHFEQTFSGHFHLKSKIGKITYIGSLFQLDWGDYGDKKRWIEISDQTISSVNTGKDIFAKLVVDKEYDFKDIDKEYYKKKFLKIIINRKLTNKEEKVLIDIIEGSIKHEIIDNTLIMDDTDIETVEDADFLDILKETIEAQENIYEDIKSGAETLIAKKYEKIQRGE